MEWGKIKTILIFIFVIVNFFLFVIFFKNEYVDTTLDKELLEDTVVILNQNNVVIEKSVLPKTHDNVRICTVENKYSSVSDMLNAARKISVQNNVNYLDEDNIEIRGNSFTCTVYQNTDVSNVVKYTKKEIGKSGLLDKTEYTVEEKDGYIYFYLKLEDKKFCDSYIKVKTTDKGIQKIYGHNWLGDVVSEGGISETVSPVEILIDFAISQDFDKKVQLKSVKSGYYIGERGETVRVTASPVWEIITSDNNVFYYDMRNGDLLK